MTDTKIKVNEDGGYVNMCEGIRLLQEEAKIQGIAEGKTEGIAEGKIIILNEMVRDGDISERRAAEKANMSEEEFRKQYMNYSFWSDKKTGNEEEPENSIQSKNVAKQIVTRKRTKPKNNYYENTFF